MRFRTRLLLIFTAAIVTSVAVVDLLVLGSTRRAYERSEGQRADTLVLQFRNEFDRRRRELVRTVNAIAASEAVRQIAVQPDPSEFDRFSVMQRRERITRLGRRTQIDRCAGAIAQLQMPGHKIRMQVGQKNVFDFQGMFSGKSDVQVSVALRIDDSGRACRLISDQVRGVRQARQIELFENHFRSPFCGRYFGCGTIRR